MFGVKVVVLCDAHDQATLAVLAVRVANLGVGPAAKLNGDPLWPDAKTFIGRPREELQDGFSTLGLLLLLRLSALCL